MKKRLALLLVQFWRPLLIGLALAIVTFAMLFMHLGGKPPALSKSEAATRESSRSLHVIFDNPVNAPLTVPEHFAMRVRPHGVAASRAMSAIYGVITLVLVFVVLRFWQRTFTALLGTALFGTSSWFLHTARLDTPDILLFGLVALIAACLWLKHTLRRNLIALVCAATLGIAIYIPGMVWFIVIGAIWYHRAILHELKRAKLPAKIFAVLVLIVVAAPLIFAIVRQPSMTRDVVGLPKHLPALAQVGHNLVQIPVQLFVHGPSDPVRWLGNLPILDVFVDAMLALGIYTFWQHRKLYRTKLLFGATIISVILISVSGPIAITILIPLVYIAAAAGILYMLDTWQSVFPHNPVARTIGALALTIAVAISCSFQLRSYFVAWQHSPATKAAFTQPAVNVFTNPSPKL